MDPKRWGGRNIVIAVALIVLVVAAAAVGYDEVRHPRLTQELRGYELAQALGCFACHGPDGTGGVPNPGSDEKEVPAWDGGNAMMYVENEREIREWILFGHPKRLAEDHDSHSHGTPDQEPLLAMPAFEGVVSDRQLEYLVAYYKVVAAFDPIPPEVRPGYSVASKNGCFGCHGPRGLVGTSNPQSFKGYIPPWRGEDYQELVKDETELRQWILEGQVGRLEANPVARYFTDRQVIQMPAYESRLSDEEVAALVAYIEWLQSNSE
jgi:mono/diheme cytochrome c family protein